MTVFLEAECVITRLTSIGFIQPKEWKKLHPATIKYFAVFKHIPTKGMLSFEIWVENSVHKVSALYINNLERIHDVDLSAITAACAV